MQAGGPAADLTLVLFDIDGTLLHCGPQVRPVFEEALTAVYGTSGHLDSYDFSGKTDDQIVHDLLASAGLGEDEIAAGLPRVKAHYLEQLDRCLEVRGMTLLPGVDRLLSGLRSRPGVVLGLLTGNWEAGARIKLSRFGLNREFPFGAFGDGQRHRGDLPPLALQRAQVATGRSFSTREAVIVGDSVLDVACARAHGIRCLAVATGHTGPQLLAAAGAERVVTDLQDPTVSDWICAGQPG